MMLMKTVCPQSNGTALHCTDELITQSTQQNEVWETVPASGAAIGWFKTTMQVRTVCCPTYQDLSGTCSSTFSHNPSEGIHLGATKLVETQQVGRLHSLVDYSQLCFGPRSGGSLFPLNENPWGSLRRFSANVKRPAVWLRFGAKCNQKSDAADDDKDIVCKLYIFENCASRWPVAPDCLSQELLPVAGFPLPFRVRGKGPRSMEGKHPSAPGNINSPKIDVWHMFSSVVVV